MASEEEDKDAVGTVYKMKVVQFLNRSVPIILQNDNGPCPLLAISNVLLLRNNVTLSLDMLEISQRELMSLVIEWLLDANNIQNKDDEFVKNQQQNIEDAIQLLPRLATGIDVNVRFRHIHDFEYTPECAIFDLFHVGLVHGWLCDPQDEVTFKVIGSNSYNTLVEKVVAVQAIKAEEASQSNVVEEPTVDFAAATIAALGVPSPKCTRRLSDEDFEAMNQADGKLKRKGDEEEAAELMQALQLSQTDNDTVSSSTGGEGFITSLASSESPPVVEERLPHIELMSVVHVDKEGVESLVLQKESVTSLPLDSTVSSTDGSVPDVLITSIVHVQREEVDSSDVTDEVLEQEFVLTPAEYTKESQFPSLRQWIHSVDGDDTSGKKALDAVVESPTRSSSSGQLESFPIVNDGDFPEAGGIDDSSSIFAVGEDVKANVGPLVLESEDVEDQTLSVSGSVGSSFEHVPLKEEKLSIDTASASLSEAEDCVSPGLDEPLYEGEQILGESQTSSVGDKEPLYEGEDVSAEGQKRDGSEGQDDRSLEDENLSVVMTEGLLIEHFLSSTASQLTYHGLFSLQEGLKNNELFVFFRNNHFSTLFKYDGQIYLLATDQGYLAQPELVWEKLTEVDGDTVFATGSFDRFQVDQSTGPWSERDAVAATTDYMSSQHMTGASVEGASFNSDLQLAMALQQQELAQQQQQQQQQQEARTVSSSSRPTHPVAKTSSLGAGRLITGPARSSIPPPKQEKAKEKCTIM